MKRGGLTDKHIRVRRQRVVPMAASLVSVIAGTVLLYVLHAPQAIAALVVAMLVGLVSALAVTVRWQISIHNAVAGGAALILILTFGPIAVPAAFIPVAVGWSRLVLKAHTMAQVIAGTALGGISALVFTPPDGRPPRLRSTFAPGAGVPEDPACGSMNAAVGQWLTGTGAAPSTYRVSQGTRLGRAASIEITADTDGTVWVSGAATVCIRGSITA
ncbi:PhzF family phenazine biosynthesis protein [Streptacidiphilus sp. PAMC 29251]